MNQMDKPLFETLDDQLAFIEHELNTAFMREYDLMAKVEPIIEGDYEHCLVRVFDLRQKDNKHGAPIAISRTMTVGDCTLVCAAAEALLDQVAFYGPKRRNPIPPAIFFYNQAAIDNWKNDDPAKRFAYLVAE